MVLFNRVNRVPQLVEVDQLNIDLSAGRLRSIKYAHAVQLFYTGSLVAMIKIQLEVSRAEFISLC